MKFWSVKVYYYYHHYKTTIISKPRHFAVHRLFRLDKENMTPTLLYSNLDDTNTALVQNLNYYNYVYNYLFLF